MYAVALKRIPLPPSALARSRTGRATHRDVVFSRSESTSADPFALLTPEMAFVREDMLKLLGSSVPSLDEVAKSYFFRPSKQLRPRLVLLFAQATNGLGAEWTAKQWHAQHMDAGGRLEELDQPMTRPDVLNDYNPSRPQNTVPFGPSFSLQPPTRSTRPSPPPQNKSVSSLVSPPVLLPTQIRLAQIVEMIHVASLLHDDVIDKSSLRRGESSAPAAYGDRLTILGGTFILGRASTALSRLGDAEVIELLADVLPNLVEGEILQLKDTHRELLESGVNKQMGRNERWSYYLQRTYLKTASLIANYVRAAVALGGCGQEEIWRDMAFTYGRNLGLAFQVSCVIGISRITVERLPTAD
jgi:hexaprenyl-diphosphate synthase